jgi:hypothetical protein
MDSWFAMPPWSPGLQTHSRHLHGQAHGKVHYIFEGQKMDVTQIYSQIRKREAEPDPCQCSSRVQGGLKAKLVFVRNKHKRDWLALLTTDLTLADEDVSAFTASAGIEVFFARQAASGTGERVPGPGHRCLIAHTTIVMTSYIFLSIEKRRTEDPRTLGLLFHRCCEEAEDCTLVKALCQILGITLEN